MVGSVPWSPTAPQGPEEREQAVPGVECGGACPGLSPLLPSPCPCLCSAPSCSPRMLRWREAGWCCSSSTPPTPPQPPGGTRSPVARWVPSPGGSCSQGGLLSLMAAELDPAWCGIALLHCWHTMEDLSPWCCRLPAHCPDGRLRWDSVAPCLSRPCLSHAGWVRRDHPLPGSRHSAHQAQNPASMEPWRHQLLWTFAPKPLTGGAGMAV